MKSIETHTIPTIQYTQQNVIAIIHQLCVFFFINGYNETEEKA